MKLKLTVSIALPGLLLAGLMGCSQPPEPAEPPAAQAPPKPAPPVKLLHFYASPIILDRGELAQMCYGVENAQSVSIEPKVKELKASYNRCFTITPTKTTTYTLTVTGESGEITEELTIKVRKPPAPPVRSPIITFIASDDEVSQMQPVTLCYSLEKAQSVRIDPPVRDLEPISTCFTLTMEKTTTFTLTATAQEGKEFQTQLTVQVN